MKYTPTKFDFLEWKDPLQWTERNSSATRKAFNAENRNFKRLLQAATGDRQIRKLQSVIEDYEIGTLDHYEIQIPEDNPVISIHWTKSAKNYTWKWINSSTSYKADTIDTCNYNGKFYVAYTIESPIEARDNDIYVRTRHSVWKHSKSGASACALQDGRLYCIESESPLKSYTVVSLAVDGGSRRVEYVETCHQTQLDFCSVEGGVFLTGDRAGYGRIWRLKPSGGVERLEPEGVAFFPVGFLQGAAVYFVRFRELGSPWTLVNCSWKLSEEIRRDGIEFCSLEHNCLVTKNFGIRTLWRMGTGAPKKLVSGIFSIVPEPCIHTGASALTLWLISPGMSPQQIRIPSTGPIKIIQGGRRYATTQIGTSRSTGDGLPVRWCALRASHRRPTGLLCIAYGSYGLPLSLDTARWHLWLKAGWTVALLFVRGGGDGNDVWAEMGRREGKLQSVDDVEGCIRHLQRISGCGAARTCLFGRSAGGTLIGNIVARYPGGELIGSAYTEVPYVDVLKTAANPALPLTEYEYEEFGNPREGPVNFEQVMRISPIHALGEGGAPGVAVLCRTGSHDLQVYPYECLKWILTLRGLGGASKPKVLYMDSEGHNSSDSKRYREQAEDFAMITSWID